MTDLQVKYQVAQETARANQAREEIQAREAAVKELEAKLEEQQVPAKIASLVASANLSNAQREKVGQEVVNLIHELDLIDQKTGLTMEQRSKAMFEAMEEKLNYTRKNTGLSWLDHLVEQVFGLFKGAGTKALFG